MMFRVVDLGPDGIEHQVVAHSPEAAAQKVIDVPLVRGSIGSNILRAKVYWTSEDQLTLVKLYTPKD